MAFCDSCPFANYTGTGIMCQLVTGSCYRVGKDTILNPIRGMVTLKDMETEMINRRIRRVKKNREKAKWIFKTEAKAAGK